MTVRPEQTGPHEVSYELGRVGMDRLQFATDT